MRFYSAVPALFLSLYLMISPALADEQGRVCAPDSTEAVAAELQEKVQRAHNQFGFIGKMREAVREARQRYAGFRPVPHAAVIPLSANQVKAVSGHSGVKLLVTLQYKFSLGLNVLTRGPALVSMDAPCMPDMNLLTRTLQTLGERIAGEMNQP